MKTKLHSKALKIICICVLFACAVIFTVFITAQDNIATETEETITPLPAETIDLRYDLDDAEQSSEQDVARIDIISYGSAIEIAMQSHPDCGPSSEIHPTGETSNRTCEFVGAKYLESINPENDPSWYVLIAERFQGEGFLEVGDSPEERLNDLIKNFPFGDDNSPENHSYVHFSIGSDNEGNAVIIQYMHYTNFIVSEINAINGEWLGEWYAIDIKSIADLDNFVNGEELKQNLMLKQ